MEKSYPSPSTQEALHKPLKTLLPELHLQEQGQPQAGGEASLPTLVSTAHSWHAKQGGLPDAVSKIQSGASAWAGTFKRALMEVSSRCAQAFACMRAR